MLALWDTSVTDFGCRELLRARSLVEVSITGDMLTDELLRVLAQLPTLRSLQIHRGPRIGDEGLGYLSGCIGLRELYLKETAISDRGLLAIRDLPQVWSLILDDTAISDESCVALADMQQLSLLSMNRTHVVGHGLAKLCDNEHFNIYLEGTPTTDEGVIALAQRISNLKLISLNQTKVGDSAAQVLSRSLRLGDVRFSHTNLTDKGLAAFTNHPSLEVIYVKGCDVSKVAVSSLKKARGELTVYGP
jgi:hypothetical protein